MVDMIGKLLALIVVLGIGFGIHSLLSYIDLYKTHINDIALAVLFLNFGASFLVFFFGVPDLKEDRRTWEGERHEEEDEDAD